jgi:hypothetical protein
LTESRQEIARKTDNDGIEQSALTIAPLAAFAESKTRRETKRQVVEKTIVVWRTHESENREARKADLAYYERRMSYPGTSTAREEGKEKRNSFIFENMTTWCGVKDACENRCPK